MIDGILEPKNSLKWNAHQLKRNNGDMTVVSQRYSGADMVAVNALNLEPSSTHSTRSPTGRCYLDIASTLLGGVPLPGRGSPHAPQPLQHASEPTISSVELRANSQDDDIAGEAKEILKYAEAGDYSWLRRVIGFWLRRAIGTWLRRVIDGDLALG